MVSKPAFSIKVLGITSNASAYFKIANCSLPLTVSPYSLNCLIKSISHAPPPMRTLPSSIVAATTPKASSRALAICSVT